MSGSVNKVILVGNLGADPELKYTPSNRPLCNLSVATNESFKDKAGVKQDRVEWHRVTVWGEQAELCAKFLAKGRSVYLEGRLQTRTWDDKDGKKRSATDIVADRVVFLGGSGAANGGERRPPGQHDEGPDAREPHNPGAPRLGEDIPF